MAVARTISIGNQSFETLRTKNLFYVDKTGFVRDWWKTEDQVTLITRPRRFGKTLNMSMMECFFSVKYKNRADLFEGLEVWADESMRAEQGTWPVIFLSFANIKQTRWDQTRKVMNEKLMQEKERFRYMMEDSMFSDNDRASFQAIQKDMDDATAATALYNLCGWLERYYGKKALIFLDEYDTPLQEAWLQGYWDEMVAYIRNLFNSTFKTNPSLGRAILTGITRVSKESIFSDMNNLKVVTTTSWKYETAFGFTEEEVFAALDEQGCEEHEKADVKQWYDGFNFGRATDIYNPWSVTSYLDERKLRAWWANTSSNSLIGRMLQQGNAGIKIQIEKLLNGEILTLPIDEEIVFNQLDDYPEAVWSLMLASGYLKVVHEPDWSNNLQEGGVMYNLAVTNRETLSMMRDMVRNWFKKKKQNPLPDFLDSMIKGNAEDMEDYLNRILINTISYFDPGNPQDAPESFYHGLVLGMMVEKKADYLVRSNRESGYGRYDVVLEPKTPDHPAVILEFKTRNPRREKDLEETVSNALSQIEKKKYDTELLARGIPAGNIRKYGVALEGKQCVVRMAHGVNGI